MIKFHILYLYTKQKRKKKSNFQRKSIYQIKTYFIKFSCALHKLLTIFNNIYKPKMLDFGGPLDILSHKLPRPQILHINILIYIFKLSLNSFIYLKAQLESFHVIFYLNNRIDWC